MAGVTTKGNTDDGCEPLPIPTLTVGFEREWISLSPLALYHWDSLSLEPWGPQRDIAYVVLSPDNETILTNVKTFFRQLNNTYSNLKLGKHVPVTKVREGIVGKSLFQNYSLTLNSRRAYVSLLNGCMHWTCIDIYIYASNII